MKNIILILLISLFSSCSYKLNTVNKLKHLSEENGRIKQRIILQELDYNIDWNKVDSLYKVKY
jgi:hypothetical protein